MACHSASLSVRFWPAVGLYFLLRPHMGMETVSWVCMLGAAPFAAIGFIKYHGMTAEKFLWVWIKSEILMHSIRRTYIMS